MSGPRSAVHWMKSDLSIWIARRFCVSTNTADRPRRCSATRARSMRRRLALSMSLAQSGRSSPSKACRSACGRSPRLWEPDLAQPSAGQPSMMRLRLRPRTSYSIVERTRWCAGACEDYPITKLTMSSLRQLAQSQVQGARNRDAQGGPRKNPELGEWARSRSIPTETGGSSANGDYEGAIQIDIDAIRSEFGAKYDRAIEQMLKYAGQQGWVK